MGRGAAAHLRLLLWWYRQCLVVYWSDKGGQRWQRGMADDLRRVAHCARIARDGGLIDGAFAASLSEAGGGAAVGMRVGMLRLRERIAAGDVLLTTQPDTCTAYLRIHRRGRAWEARPAPATS